LYWGRQKDSEMVDDDRDTAVPELDYIDVGVEEALKNDINPRMNLGALD